MDVFFATSISNRVVHYCGQLTDYKTLARICPADGNNFGGRVARKIFEQFARTRKFLIISQVCPASPGIV
jgi:hypothetical protein